MNMGDFSYSVPSSVAPGALSMSGSRPATAGAAASSNAGKGLSPRSQDAESSVRAGKQPQYDSSYEYPRPGSVTDLAKRQPHNPSSSLDLAAHYTARDAPVQQASYNPPGSAGGPNGLWGYTVPSPPGLSNINTAGPASGSHTSNGHPMSANLSHSLPNGHSHPYPSATYPIPQAALQAYNVSNTRPMTAPSGVNNPSWYHHMSHGGGMFSPATYNGAGFGMPHREFASLAGMPSQGAGAAPNSASRSGHFQQLPTLSEDPTSYLPSGSSDIFSHQPPPIPSTSYSARPGTATSEYEDRYRPGTSDTTRPDTAISMYSNYSTQTAHPDAYSIGHPSLYNTVANSDLHGSKSAMNDYHQMQNSHSYANGGPTLQQRPGTAGEDMNFITTPGQPKKRPRRRFEEIERLYDCNYPGCNKAYGTLNHLNAHVSMQKHGPKRLPAEFKEVRKAWRQKKKEYEAQANRDEQENANAERRPSTGGGLTSHNQGAPQLPSLASSVIKHQLSSDASKPLNASQQSLVTPPSTGPMPPIPMFGGLQQYHGYYPSPNSYARPSTAPNQVPHHPFGITGLTPPNNLNGTSPMNAGFPPSAAASYLAARRPSLTSLSPAFPSIQEDAAGEHIAQLDPGASISASISPQSGQEGDAQFGHSVGAGYESYKRGMQNTLVQSGLSATPTPPPASNVPQRPSTAGSPFRYSANSSAVFTANNEDYPSLPPHLEDPAAETRRANTSDGFAGLTALSDAGGSWSPDWKSLTQRYGTEIH